MGQFSLLDYKSVYTMVYGIYWLFTGLNSFFNFRPPPRGSDDFTAQVENLYKMKFILPLVKVLEVVFGLMLALNYKSKLALAGLLPVLVGIICLQFLFNQNSRKLIFTLVISFLIAAICQNDWSLLWNVL